MQSMFDNSIFMKNKSDKCKIKIKIECCTKNETIGVCFGWCFYGRDLNAEEKIGS